MSEVERVMLAYRRGRAAALNGLPVDGSHNPYPRAMWIHGFYVDGWRSVRRDEARAEINVARNRKMG